MKLFCKNSFLLFCIFILTTNVYATKGKEPQPGAYRLNAYLGQLLGKNVALVVNHTSMVNSTHLADTLLSRGVKVKKYFAPEHGFRGSADAGAHINNEVDQKTGLPIISLYGKHKKPTKEDLEGINMVVFDIQDVGTRFYTYISTLQYVMEACAENNVPLLILDRGNPNGKFIDGPVLDRKFLSFVGINPIPLLHGCTIGELAQMFNGEKWLNNGIHCDLTVILVKNYRHSDPVHISIAPSPNLPNDQAIALYPSLCLFEGTNVSVGRGTDLQFQVVGTNVPGLGDYQFTPVPKPGAMDPPLKNQVCYGFDLSKIETKNMGLNLKYLFYFFEQTGKKESFFTSPAFFDKLAGTDQLRLQMIAGKTEEEIRSSWKEALNEYKKMRKKYIIYPK
ncbi:MAG: exo-beta-N-acetylmuramidase NamZ domain-containing protein [Aquirufa sp.]